jgi:hypothetical protein
MNIEERIRKVQDSHFPCLVEGWPEGKFYVFCDATDCGFSSKIDRWGVVMTSFLEHQASVLAGIIQPELFEAYELGRDHEFAKSVMKQQIPDNPYRKEEG